MGDFKNLLMSGITSDSDESDESDSVDSGEYSLPEDIYKQKRECTVLIFFSGNDHI